VQKPEFLTRKSQVRHRTRLRGLIGHSMIANSLQDPASNEAQEGNSDDTVSRTLTHEAYVARIGSLYQRQHEKLVRFLASRAGSREEAKDIAAEAFATLLAQRPDSVRFPQRYLYRTARNLAADYLRRRSAHRRKHHLVEYEPLASSPSPEPLLTEDERSSILQRSIMNLPPRIRMAVVLRIWDQLPYDEIVTRVAGKGVKLTERTIRRYIQQALARCRHEILASENPRLEKPREK
jgi:RNA polymerase sigma factor (sigma-70 family)